MGLNPDVSGKKLQAGQTILLPAAKLSARDKEILDGIGSSYRVYPVRKGETVADIMAKRGIQKAEMQALNPGMDLNKSQGACACRCTHARTHGHSRRHPTEREARARAHPACLVVPSRWARHAHAHAVCAVLGAHRQQDHQAAGQQVHSARAGDADWVGHPAGRVLPGGQEPLCDWVWRT